MLWWDLSVAVHMIPTDVEGVSIASKTSHFPDIHRRDSTISVIKAITGFSYKKTALFIVSTETMFPWELLAALLDKGEVMQEVLIICTKGELPTGLSIAMSRCVLSCTKEFVQYDTGSTAHVCR